MMYIGQGTLRLLHDEDIARERLLTELDRSLLATEDELRMAMAR